MPSIPAPHPHEQSAIPPWLTELGAEIASCVRQHHDRIAVMVERWGEQQRKRGPLGTHGPLPFRRDHKPALEDDYAIIAAVYSVAMPSCWTPWSEEGEWKITPSPRLTFEALLFHIRCPYTLREADEEAFRACMGRVRNDLARQDEPTPEGGIGKGVPKEEATVLVRRWLRDHQEECRDDPKKATVRRIAHDTGVSTGGVSGTTAWQAFSKQRDGEPKARREDAPGGDMDNYAAPNASDDTDLHGLTEEEQKRELDELVAEQTRDKRSNHIHLN